MPKYQVDVPPELEHFIKQPEDRYDYDSEEFREWDDKKMVIQSDSWLIVWTEEEDPDGEHLVYIPPGLQYRSHSVYAPEITIFTDDGSTLGCWFIDSDGKRYRVELY